MTLPHGEGGSPVPRKRETDEGKEYFKIQKVSL